jgi:sigma-B regulation protein RsbU (phosphoserine phosphatase)
MGQLGVSRTLLMETEHRLLEYKGFRLTEGDDEFLKGALPQLDRSELYLRVEELPDDQSQLRDFLLGKKIRYLVNISEGDKHVFLGMGLKFNKIELKKEDLEFSFFISRFAMIAIDNAFMLNRIIETKRIEHEIEIASDIQQSLLPQDVPELQNFELAVTYKPINEVGGDYYDILRERNGRLPVLIADVEGKGLPAALLAASSQAIFHSLNELYFFEPAKFVGKANSLICDFTKGNRFITLFWMLVDDLEKTVTYVNAGHEEPLLISGDEVKKLSTGGFLTGFLGSAEYSADTLNMQKGDLIVAFTDGVPEVETPDGKEFGKEALIEFFKRNSKLSAKKMTDKLLKEMLKYSAGTRFRDDYTLLVLKAK